MNWYLITTRRRFLNEGADSYEPIHAHTAADAITSYELEHGHHSVKYIKSAECKCVTREGKMGDFHHDSECPLEYSKLRKLAGG